MPPPPLVYRTGQRPWNCTNRKFRQLPRTWCKLQLGSKCRATQWSLCFCSNTQPRCRLKCCNRKRRWFTLSTSLCGTTQTALLRKMALGFCWSLRLPAGRVIGILLAVMEYRWRTWRRCNMVWRLLALTWRTFM